MSKKQSNNKYISVFIPFYNGDKYVTELLEAVISQRLPKGYELEILATDSGSSDNTVELIRKYGDRVILNEIPNSEFGHGKTRQAAVNRARGEFILFLSQDATPANERWLINMIEPFFISDKVGCVFGRQTPRPDSVPTIKREVSSVFGGIGAPDSIVIHRERSLVDGFKMNSLNTFFSDVNSAVRKDLLNKIPFRDVKYAEDQALAEDMQNKGYLKSYSPSGVVRHSNEYGVGEFRKRKFDEYIGLQESVKYVMTPSYKSLLLGWIRPTIADWKFTFRDTEYRKKWKIKYFFLVPAYNIMLELGKFQAAKFIDDHEAQKKHSLEQSRVK